MTLPSQSPRSHSPISSGARNAQGMRSLFIAVAAIGLGGAAAGWFLTHKSGKPQERGAFLIKVGLTIYDTFSRDGGTVPRHRFLGRKKSLAELPSLDPKIKYTATYYDASMHDPERLALDVLQDGRSAHPGAVALN